MSELVKYCVVGSSVTARQVSRVVHKYNISTVVFQAGSKLDKSETPDLNIIEHLWNDKDSVGEMKIESMAFKILDSFQHDLYVQPMSSVIGNQQNLSMLEQLARKIYVESYADVLKTVAIAIQYISKQVDVTLVLSQRHRETFVAVHNYISMHHDDESCSLRAVDDLRILYSGSSFFSSAKIYAQSLSICLYYLSSIRWLGRPHKAKYRLGLLAWNSALRIPDSKIDNEGLDSVIPEDFPPDQVLVYSKDILDDEYQQSVLRRGYALVLWDRKYVYRKSTVSDIGCLIKSFLLILIMFPFVGRKIYTPLQLNLAKILYHYLKWTKFVDLYTIELSLSYNDYAVGDLVRNWILMNAGVRCWGYVHSCADRYLFDNTEALFDVNKSFISFDKRFYLLPNQVDYFAGSRISSAQTSVVGPLFSSYRSRMSLPSSFSVSRIISFFTCSMGVMLRNPDRSHKVFFQGVFSLFEKASDDCLFIVKIKGSYDENCYDGIFDLEQARRLIEEKRLLIVGGEVDAGEVIRLSKGVVSMAFTSPSIEAIAAGIPGVFYDPAKIFIHNPFVDITDLYLTEYNQLQEFLVRVLDGSSALQEWTLNTKRSIGITKEMIGISRIHDEVADYFMANSTTSI